MPGQEKDIQIYLRLVSYVKSYWRQFCVSILCMVLMAATTPALAALMKPLMDGAFIEKDPMLIKWMPILLVILFIFRGITSYIGEYSLLWVSNKVVMDIQYNLFVRIITLPVTFFEQHTPGKIISKFTYDALQIKQAATNAITTLIRDSLAIVGLLIWMLYISWQLTFIALVSAPLITVVVLVIRKRLRRMSRNSQDAMGDINQIINESINGHKLIKLYSAQEQEINKFGKAINAYRHYQMKFVAAAVASGPVMQIITAFFFAIIIYLATRQALAGSLTVGSFVSFVSAMALLLDPLKRLARINELIQRGLAACEDIFSLLDYSEEKDYGQKEIEGTHIKIEFRNITFRYPGSNTDALSNLSFDINAGQTIALVGASGSGKTTTVNLLPKFYDINEGNILIDDTDIKDITLESIRKNIAFVGQDIVMFNDTVRNNIAFGELRDSSEEEIVAAAKAAYAMEFINELPQGMDTVIGEKGLRLSGGQRQRIAIARALLKDAPVLILDEATSSLDHETERQIQQALERLKKGKTCLIIAHRISTIINADRILVMDQGKIVESGTHEELIAKNSVYANLNQIFLEGHGNNL